MFSFSQFIILSISYSIIKGYLDSIRNLNSGWKDLWITIVRFPFFFFWFLFCNKFFTENKFSSKKKKINNNKKMMKNPLKTVHHEICFLSMYCLSTICPKRKI